jgi:hypothetical protein
MSLKFFLEVDLSQTVLRHLVVAHILERLILYMCTTMYHYFFHIWLTLTQPLVIGTQCYQYYNM